MVNSRQIRKVILSDYEILDDFEVGKFFRAGFKIPNKPCEKEQLKNNTFPVVINEGDLKLARISILSRSGTV